MLGNKGLVNRRVWSSCIPASRRRVFWSQLWISAHRLVRWCTDSPVWTRSHQERWSGPKLANGNDCCDIKKFKHQLTSSGWRYLHRPRSRWSDPSSRNGWGSRPSVGCRPDLYACQASPCCPSWSSYRHETPPGTYWRSRGTQTPCWGTTLQRPWWWQWWALTDLQLL